VSRQVPNSLIAVCASNYSTGGLSESSNTDSDSESEVESGFDDGPVHKKRKANDSQCSKQSESPSIGIMKRQT
jgi:hypothetical protein